jgi:DNA-binding MarR family transcriptional regulator
VADEYRLTEIVKKWKRLMYIGWKEGSKNDVRLKLNDYMDRMSQRQVEVLCLLDSARINTISEMAKFFGISKSTLSIVMNKLVAKELVVKEYPKNSDDGRRVYFKISQKGKELFQNIDSIYIEGLAVTYERFTPEQRAFFKEGIESLKKINDKNVDLFTILDERTGDREQYSEELRKIAADILYFLVNSRLSKLSGAYDIKLPDNLTENQMHLLLCVGVGGMNSLTKLEKYLGSSGSALSIGISKMVDRGYISKDYPTTGQDGRMVFLRVTERGKNILAQAESMMSECFIKRLSELDDERLDIMEHACDCLLKALSDFDNIYN